MRYCVLLGIWSLYRLQILVTWSGLGLSQGGVDGPQKWFIFHLAQCRILEPGACPELQHRWSAKLSASSFLCLTRSCCIRFCQKAALEELLISARFMARCADCASLGRVMIYNYICGILMAPGVWFRQTIKCTLASVSLQEAKQADSAY